MDPIRNPFVPGAGAIPPELAGRQALLHPATGERVGFEPEALDEIVRITRGHPYFLQEWAYQSWNAAPTATIRLADVEAGGERAIARLDGSFFRMRFERLTPREKEYCVAMAALGPGPHRSGARP